MFLLTLSVHKKTGMGKCEQCIVRKFNSLNVLKKEDLIEISNCKESQIVKKGEIIFEEGEALNGVYCVRDGVCKLSKLSVNGKEQILKLAFKGDMLGQRSLLGNERSNLKAVAVNDMQICFIPKQNVIGNLNKNITFSLDIMKQMAHDLKDADNTIVNMAQKTVKKRLADTLIYIYKNFGVDEKNYLKIVLSREDYANIVGTATESAIRIFSKFKKDGLIRISGKQIGILDLEGLRRIE